MTQISLNFSHRPGTKPISPYKWVKQNIEYFVSEVDIEYEQVQQKIMMGVPFYGFKIENHSKIGHVLASEYQILLKHKVFNIYL